MARTGLTKSQVRTIRDRLLAEGRYPSVDAVRHALGDTGSKSTIHKHLKALGDEAAGGAGDARQETGRALHAIVEQLADRLHADADERLRALLAGHERALREKDAELARLRGTVAALHARVQRLEDELAAGQPPAASWDAGRVADGFGRFDSLALSSRCVGRDISPFGMVRTASREAAFGGGGWPEARGLSD
ncbi:DNA-binding protein [uncultured Massilia sp.]|uniref:DNA-binding protein n=1 Tax=uncultured Massilia sp. TaxID=169973 RepID=UPI0025DD3F5C|nr:DNA-binding protein [uncultured Massilia sp.]